MCSWVTTLGSLIKICFCDRRTPTMSSFLLHRCVADLSASSAIRVFFFFQAEDGIRDVAVTGVQTCALPISVSPRPSGRGLTERTTGAHELPPRGLGDGVEGAHPRGAYRAVSPRRRGGGRARDRKSVV